MSVPARMEGRGATRRRALLGGLHLLVTLSTTVYVLSQLGALHRVALFCKPELAPAAQAICAVVVLVGFALFITPLLAGRVARGFEVAGLLLSCSALACFGGIMFFAASFGSARGLPGDWTLFLVVAMDLAPLVVWPGAILISMRWPSQRGKVGVLTAVWVAVVVSAVVAAYSVRGYYACL